MKDKIFQKKFVKAWNYKKEKKFVKATELYVELYRQLIKDALEHFKGTSKSETGDRKRVEEYLKGDNLACTILNNIGVIFAEIGDKKSAKKYFEESIKLTPTRLDYQNPKIGLKELKK